ncbi:hypothetical protein KUTeg_024845 [Tegillarca granosa]|uniref:Uncharacterized protein n=1 Tax=Tegillarca granosa TaxID=220873 RepID=A0ABQ9DZ16_TEGGR|nr:hypothetical protein KUTeg_024845 [Tegillarca granosa]
MSILSVFKRVEAGGDTVTVDIGSRFDTYVSGGGWSSFTGWKICDTKCERIYWVVMDSHEI